MNKLNMELQDQTQSVVAYLAAISDAQAGVESSVKDTVFKEGYAVCINCVSELGKYCVCIQSC